MFSYLAFPISNQRQCLSEKLSLEILTVCHISPKMCNFGVAHLISTDPKIAHISFSRTVPGHDSVLELWIFLVLWQEAILFEESLFAGTAVLSVISCTPITCI